MELLASGRGADVFALDVGRVLRRYRDGRSALREAETLRTVVAVGFPAPAVHATDGPDIVMDRVDGPTLGAALLDGTMPVDEAGATLARLHRALYAIEVDGGTLVHLDLHPLNVILAPAGPVAIDWTDARPGSTSR
ncbi:phosphotransferase [Isoptericola croceus]|uniref:phosphotransferase n=1 Tax=Isoptericola croceus TaxID=3031406 RepID=UPI0023F9441D|nr:phosphotransferase [Isoptericola croceus]